MLLLLAPSLLPKLAGTPLSSLRTAFLRPGCPHALQYPHLSPSPRPTSSVMLLGILQSAATLHSSGLLETTSSLFRTSPKERATLILRAGDLQATGLSQA